MAIMQSLLARLFAAAAALGCVACRLRCSQVQGSEEWLRIASLYNAAAGPSDILDFTSGQPSPDFMLSLTPQGAHNLFDSVMAQENGERSSLTAALLSPFLTEAATPRGAPGPCSLFVEFLEHVPLVDCLPAMCREEYVTKCSALREETAAGLTRGWMQSHGADILSCWGRRRRSMHLFWLPSEALYFIFNEYRNTGPASDDGRSRLARQDTLCSRITLDMLVGLSKDQLKMISPACAKDIQMLDQPLLTTLLGKLPVAFFREYEGVLADSTVSALSPGMVIELGNRHGGSTAACPMCRNLDLRLLSPHAAEGLSISCILANLTSRNTGLGATWRHVTVIEKICKIRQADWKVLLEGVPLADFEFFPKELVRCMLEEEDRVELLADVPGEIFLDESIGEVRMTPSALAVLSESHPELCGQILVRYSRIPNQALAYVEGEAILGLSAFVNGRHRVGFELLAVLASLQADGAFLYNTTSSARVHMCTLIASEEELLSLHWLWPYLSPQCIRHLQFPIRDSLVVAIPRLLYGRGVALSFVKGLSKTLPENSTLSRVHVGQTMRESIMCSTVGGSNGVFCRLLERFDDDTMRTIDRHCSLHLRACLTEAVIPRLPSDAFYHYSSETKPSPALHLLRPAQIPFVSLGVSLPSRAIRRGQHSNGPAEGSGKSLFLGLTSSNLAIWTDSQISAITAMQWSVTDCSATAVISPALMPLLSHKRMSLLSTGHIENLPLAAVCRMLPSQVSHVGLLADAKVDRLEEASPDMMPDSYRALNARTAFSRDRAVREAKEEALFRAVTLPVVILSTVTALLAFCTILFMRQAIQRAKAAEPH